MSGCPHARLEFPREPTLTRKGALLWRARCVDCGAVVWRAVRKETRAKFPELAALAEERRRAAPLRKLAEDRAARPPLRPDRLALLKALAELGGIIAGCRDGSKRPISAKRGVEGGWRAHHAQGFLGAGLEQWVRGEVEEACYWPATFERLDGATAMILDGDRPGSKAAAWSSAAAAVPSPSKPDRWHFLYWLAEGERAGNGSWPFGEVRHETRGGNLGLVRPYPGELQALASTLDVPAVRLADLKPILRSPRKSKSKSKAKAKAATGGTARGAAKEHTTDAAPARTDAAPLQVGAAVPPPALPPGPASGSGFAWDYWRSFPLAEVREGCRDCWLFAHAVEAAATKREDPQAALSRLNADLPCAPLPEGQVEAMVLYVARWAAYRARMLGRPYRIFVGTHDLARAARKRSAAVRTAKAAERDGEIAALAAQGLSGREIGRRTGKSERAVRRALARIRAGQGAGEEAA